MHCLSIIIPIVILIALIIIRIIFKPSNSSILDVIIAIISMAMFLFAALFSVPYADKNSSFDKLYKETIYKIETYDIDKDPNLNVLNDILRSASNINAYIKETQKNKDSVFIGFLYKDEIADYDYIVATQLKTKLKTNSWI
jgi:hypothetical protein